MIRNIIFLALMLGISIFNIAFVIKKFKNMLTELKNITEKYNTPGRISNGEKEKSNVFYSVNTLITIVSFLLMLICLLFHFLTTFPKPYHKTMLGVCALVSIIPATITVFIYKYVYQKHAIKPKDVFTGNNVIDSYHYGYANSSVDFILTFMTLPLTIYDIIVFCLNLTGVL